MCCAISYITLMKTKSHHYPLLLEFHNSHNRFAYSFKLNMLAPHEDCKSIVSEVLINNFIGCPMFVLSTNLKLLKNKINLN